ALATVVEVHGRAPLPAGSCLAVAADGRTAGAVSGGCVEAEVVRAAQEVLAGGPARRLRFAPGGDELTGSALPCGGGIDVWVQRWSGEDAPGREGSADRADPAGDPVSGPAREAIEQAAFSAAVRAERDAVLPIRTLAWQRDALEKYVLEASAPPTLALIGAGIVAGALCTQARALGWATTIVDPRVSIAAHAPISDARRLILKWPEEAFLELGPLGPADAVVALSHQPALDDAALRAALLGEAGFIGAIGSRRSHAERIARLRAGGCTERELARIVGPIGLDLGTSDPAEVAVSIVAELIAARNGRRGGRLSEGDGRIGADDGARYRLTALSPLRGTGR
ncbi:MAG: XdhC family protein, partial [Solirubrobacteraceae bacterium]|nr:XdhC family protein [Solirubrobacteraceae bacterium]